MKAAAFLVALRRQARAVSSVQEPLAEARRFLDAHGETMEGQALGKVIETLATGTGEFSESDVWPFSAERLALVSTLVEACMDGRYSDEEWRQATRQNTR